LALSLQPAASYHYACRASFVPTRRHCCALSKADAWDDLLNHIEERRVIPIARPGAAHGRRPRPARALRRERLAARLAARLSVDPAPTGHAAPSLNDVVAPLPRPGRGRREEAYTRLRTILREAAVRPADRARPARGDRGLRPLRHRRPSTRLLEQARSTPCASAASGQHRGRRLRAQPASPTCRPSATTCSARPLVDHLLGRLSASPT